MKRAIVTSLVVLVCILAIYYSQKSSITPVKIFQIGFSKCGTTTLHYFFERNGIASVHHASGDLPISIYKNAIKGDPLISERYQNYWVFTDMERIYADPQINIPMTLFKDLDKQYPGSKFILNIRDKQAWLNSRSQQLVMTETGKMATFLEITQKILNKSAQAVLAQWSQEWDDHLLAVREYFKNRPHDLVEFNIDTDPPEKLIEFFKENFILDAKFYDHTNRTADRADIKAKSKGS